MSTAYSRAHCCTCRAVSTGMHTHLPAAAKELAESSKSLKLAAIPSIGRLCITATLLPVLENGDCAGTVRRGAPDPAYAAPREHTTFTMHTSSAIDAPAHTPVDSPWKCAFTPGLSKNRSASAAVGSVTLWTQHVDASVTKQEKWLAACIAPVRREITI